MAIVQRHPRAAEAPLARVEKLPVRSERAAGSVSRTNVALPQLQPDHPPGHIRFSTPFFVTALTLFVSLNYVLLRVVPYGWVLELALLVWALFIDKVAFNGKGRPIVAFRRAWWWDSMRSYFPITLHQEQDFDGSKPLLFVIHPHGVFGFGAWLSFAADCVGFSRKNRDIDIAMATVNVNFFLPFWRDALLALGLVDASFQSLSAALQRGRSVAIVLGGAAEALDSHPGTYDIILNKRKGIIRLALSTGTAVVPVFTFGETDLFYQVPNPAGSRLRRVQDAFLAWFRVSPPLVVGRGILGCPAGILPYAVPLHVVTGTPIPVPHIPAPSSADVAKYQEIYRRALEKLYADHAQRYYDEILPPHLRPSRRPELRVVA
ncbi:hypothetical protein PybrP1_000011 [[Pythium] brassicae (nom. inval.)]|nr:hypothetical protein PybrP1_000011 [[Pythium] brassicae (nom. inval.)]